MPTKGASAVQSRSAIESPVDQADQAALRELSQVLGGVAGDQRAGEGLWPDPDFPELQLDLADLVSDRNGEVAMYNDSGARTRGIATDARIVAGGLAASHVTAGGADVSGYRFVTFDNGLTLYFHDGLELIVRSTGAAAS